MEQWESESSSSPANSWGSERERNVPQWHSQSAAELGFASLPPAESLLHSHCLPGLRPSRHLRREDMVLFSKTRGQKWSANILVPIYQVIFYRPHKPCFLKYPTSRDFEDPLIPSETRLASTFTVATLLSSTNNHLHSSCHHKQLLENSSKSLIGLGVNNAQRLGLIDPIRAVI